MRRQAWIVLVAALMAAGCAAPQVAQDSGEVGSAPAEAQVEEAAQVAEEDAVEDESQEDADSAEAVEEEAEAGSEAEADAAADADGAEAEDATDEDDAGDAEADSAAEPPQRSGMEATDPATVALGQGTPQLVEFFAFW